MFIYRLNKVLAAFVGAVALWLLFTSHQGSAHHFRLALLLYTSLLILIISGFAQNNLQGQERYLRFGLLLLVTSIGIFSTFISTNLLLIGFGWSTSGIGATLLVNHANSNRSRRATLEIARWLIVSETAFWLALLLAHTHHLNLFTDPTPNLRHSSLLIDLIATLLMTSGVIRSGLFPAMRWLILTVEAPSPLSALLHAGIVNGFGFLLVVFPIIHHVRYLILLISLVTIILALAIMRHRHDEKGKLANGTSMQMAFMALEGVLGNPGVVLLHIIGHGSYKSWSFLRAGGAPLRRKNAMPIPTKKESKPAITISLAIAYLLTLGAAYFWLGIDFLLNISVGSIALASSLIFVRKLSIRLLTQSALLTLFLFGFYVIELRFASQLFPQLWKPELVLAITASLSILIATTLLRVIPRGWTLQIASRIYHYVLPHRESRSALKYLSATPSDSIDPKTLLELIEITSSPFAEGMALSQIVAQNPLVGLQNLDFHAASQIAGNYGISLYSSPNQYLEWLDQGIIKWDVLEKCTTKENSNLSADEVIFETRSSAKYSNRPLISKNSKSSGPSDWVTSSASWWCAQAWYDGVTNSSVGAYEMWRSTLHVKHREKLPKSSLEALAQFLPAVIQRTSPLSEITEPQITFALQQLISLDISWFMFVKGLGQDAVHSLLAIRVALASLTNYKFSNTDLPETPYAQIWQAALEQSYSEELVTKMHQSSAANNGQKDNEIAIVTCIDVRSDILREKAELVPGVRTIGMAGFFGVDLCVTGFRNGNNPNENFAPVILKPRLTLEDRRKITLQWELPTLWKYATSGSGALAIAEGFGLMNGVLSALNTCIPKLSAKLNRFFGAPRWLGSTGLDLSHITREQKIQYATNILATLLPQTLKEVIFVGHGADAPNTPFYSMFECGACGGNNGLLNARFATALMNDPVVQDLIKETHGIASIRFFAAEHNTTLASVQLDPRSMSAFQNQASADLKNLLQQISLLPKRAFPTSEEFIKDGKRTNFPSNAANAWWQVFPEWGLSGNGACVIGPRSLTKNFNLRSRVFLHDYAWEEDVDNQVLVSIFSGPGVVMQMINAAYNVAATNPKNFSSGDKTRHNVLGEAGVLLGADGPLYRGLPWQSIAPQPPAISGNENGHIPRRLQIFVAAPPAKIMEALEQSTLAPLAAGGWVSVHALEDVK